MKLSLPSPSQSVLKQISEIEIPKMYLIEQCFENEKIKDIERHLELKFSNLSISQTWYYKKRIAIAVGSRGIPNLQQIIKWICDKLKDLGAKPFIVPAMGSHGGATSEGQLAVLKHYGISEDTMCVPVISSLDVLEYGKLSNGRVLYCDKATAKADGIIVVNKVKPHTDFRGDIESGLSKMAMIGLGNHKGASSFHTIPFKDFPIFLREGCEKFLETFPVVFGVGIVQNAYDEIHTIEFAERKDYIRIDCELLALAKEKMARFTFPETDILIIDEIGKNFSGFGQDPNVTGRSNGYRAEFAKCFHAKRMIILGISEESEGNGVGISEADVSTRKCLESINWDFVWTNLLTSTEIQGAKIPMYGESQQQAIQIALRGCSGLNPKKSKIVRIKNTASLNIIEISSALYANLSKSNNNIKILKGPYFWNFDSSGMLPKYPCNNT